MTNLAKASIREKELDVARCKGNWSEVPELARKYRKHNPAGVVLQQSALAEYALVRAIEKTESNYDDDSPEHITLHPTVNEELIKDVFEKIEVALAEAQGHEKKYASIILARAYFVVGNYSKCVEALSIDFVPSELPTGYSFILVFQGLVLKGMAHEALSDFDDAIACYDQAVILLSQNSNEKQDQLSNWTEEALYRVPLLKVQLGDKKEALQAFRTYQSYAALWGDKFRINKRAVIYKYFIKLLVEIYQEGIYDPPSATSNEQSTIYTPHTFRIELTGLHKLYEDALIQITTFPKSGEINWRVLEMVDQVMSDWVVLGGGTAAEMRELIEMLRRATHKTFQSPRILRHLINTLITYGDYEEAELALNAYIALVEKAKETKIEDIEKQMHGLLEENEKISSPDKHKMMVETSEQVVQMLIIGSELMAKYMDKSQETLEIAQKAVHWYEDDSNLEDDELLAHALRNVGIGYSLLAAEETDPKKRPELHNKSIEALNKSISLDSEAFESHYQLSLEYATIRDISQAITSVKQALTLNSSSIPCWHLLVLLFSSQKDFQGALKACELGLKESDLEPADSTVDYSTSSALGNDDGDGFFSLKLTQNALQELANGPEAAILNFDKLFMLYGKLYPDFNIITSPNGSVYDAASLRKQNMTYEETLIPATAKPPVSNNSAKSFTEGSISSAGNKDTLGVPKANYTPSIASSRNSASSGPKRSPAQTISGVQLSTVKSATINSPQATLKAKLRRQRASKALIDLWLASASTFRRLGNLEEAQKAIESAEEVDVLNPDVWCQFGLLLFEQGNYTDAITSFYKALSIDNKHVPSMVHLARTYMKTDDLEMAEGLLDSVTKSNGWNCAEAWFYLGKICKVTDRIKRTKDCLWYALDLEETKPVKPFNVLPGCL
ncbi:hypothetical protein C1645_775755 [Glomus cerebriforme]|uniref:TPR-like protein n=1 Tax=Glomus cerebriforme TaxID=658196 RepID=A0A397SQW4_9GLOM|nr:hypothetical protein C1645_775755 [Glomus cerebriforme]